MRNILLIGRSGQIGHELQQTLPALGQLIAVGRERIDLTLPETIRTVVRDIAPNVIVNAAAYTAVDQAETETDRAEKINGTAPGILAEEAKRLGALLVHYSTDYVFDGGKSTPYTEADAPNPINAYGATKLAGEQAIRDTGGPHLILRTSWVYSQRRSNFLRSMLRLAREREHLQVVSDQTGSPTSAPWIAEATTQILERILEHESRIQSGMLYHLSSEGEATWHEFAKAIFDCYNIENVAVKPISSSDYGARAPRPDYSVLSNQKVATAFDVTIPTWQEQLRAVRQMESAN